MPFHPRRFSSFSFALFLPAVAGLLGTLGCGMGTQVDNPALKYAYLIDSEPQIVSHWSLAETDGTIAYDSTGRNNGIYTFGTSTPGMSIGQPGPLSGFVNYAAVFSPPSTAEDTTNSGEIIIPYSSTM